MTNAKRLTALIMAMIMCIGMLVSCGEKDLTVEDVQKDPYAAVQTGITNYSDALIAKFGLNKLADSLKNGAATYDIDASIPEAGDISLDLVADAKTKAASGKLNVSIMGISSEASLWADSKAIVLDAPAVLGEGKYGVALETLATDLENSAIAETFGLGQDTIKEITGSLNSDTDAAASLKEALSGVTPAVADEALKIGETETPAISVEYTLNKDQFVKLIEAVPVASEALAMDAETMAEADVTVKAKFWLNKSTKAVMAVDLELTDNTTEGNVAKASIVLGADPAALLDITVTADIESADWSTEKSVITVKETNADGKTTIAVESKNDITYVDEEFEDESYTNTATVTIDADGKYEFKAVDGLTEEETAATGTLSVSDTALTLTVDSMTMYGETAELDISVAIKTEGTVEALPEYKNILTMTEDELAAMSETIAASPIGGMLFMGGMGSEDDLYYEDIYGDEYGDIYGDEYDENYDPYEGIDPYEGMTDEEIQAYESMLEELMTMEFDDSEIYA